jgi:hypothetical protein
MVINRSTITREQVVVVVITCIGGIMLFLLGLSETMTQGDLIWHRTEKVNTQRGNGLRDIDQRALSFRDSIAVMSKVDGLCGCNMTVVHHGELEINDEQPYSCPRPWSDEIVEEQFNPGNKCSSDDLSLNTSESASEEGFDDLQDYSLDNGTDPYADELHLRGFDPTCARYIIAEHNGSGLGHRHGVVVFAANLAMEFGFTLVLGDSLRDSVSIHGHYPAFRELLGLTRFLYASELLARQPALSHYVVDSREAFVAEYTARLHAMCGVAVTAHLGGHTSCRSAAFRLPKVPARLNARLPEAESASS